MNKILSIIFFIVLLFSGAYSQSYYVKIQDLQKVNDSKYIFSIYIGSENKIKLSAYMGSISFNQGLKIDTIKYIPGTCAFKNNIQYNSILTDDNVKEFVFASEEDKFSDLIYDTPVLLGKFEIIKKSGFKDKRPKFNLAWNFSGDFYTAILGTNYKDITDYFIFKTTKYQEK